MCRQNLRQKERQIREAVNSTEEIPLTTTTNLTWEPEAIYSDDMILTQREIIVLAGISAILTYLIIIMIYIITEINYKQI